MVSRNKNFKLVLLGDTAVGKSCIASRFVRREYHEFQEPTIGAAFLTKSIVIDDHDIKFEIWDTAGQERYRSLAPMYYRGASCALIIYDITSNDSLNGAKLWLSELKSRAPNCHILLVGNKSDLENERDIDFEKINEIKNKYNIEDMLVSAKTGNNIDEVFYKIGKYLHENVEDLSKNKKENINVLTYKYNDNVDTKSNSCCLIV